MDLASCSKVKYWRQMRSVAVTGVPSRPRCSGEPAITSSCKQRRRALKSTVAVAPIRTRSSHHRVATSLPPDREHVVRIDQLR